MSTGEVVAAPVVRICSAGRGLLGEGPRWDAGGVWGALRNGGALARCAPDLSLRETAP